MKLLENASTSKKSLLENQTKEKVIQYYIHTDTSYQNWGNSEGYEIHYGYKDSEKQNHYDALKRMNQIVAEKAGISTGAVVLDAGCGVGSAAIWAAKKFNTQVYGISLSSLQIKKAKEFARFHKVDDKAHFSVQDYTQTKFPDNFFDVVWAMESMCHSYSKVAFLKEIFRILKPGGKIVVADYFLVKDKLREIEKYSLDRWLEGWAMPSLASQKSFVRVAGQMGYEKIETQDITENIIDSAQNIYLRGKHGYPDDILTKTKTIVKIKHTEGCMFQKIALDLGIWRYLLFSAQK